MRFLIVDDSKSVLKSVSWRIQKMGYQVAGTGADGLEGIEQYKKIRPDLMLLDITMPNMDGRQCLKGIMELDPSARVVILSALSSADVIEECIQLGALAFIDKNLLMTNDYLERRIGEIILQIPKVAA